VVCLINTSDLLQHCNGLGLRPGVIRVRLVNEAVEVALTEIAKTRGLQDREWGGVLGEGAANPPPTH